MPEPTRQQRNEEIVRLYNEGVPGTDLAERFDVSRQRISQILRASDAVAAPAAREVRADRRRRELEESVQDFLTRYGDSLEELAAVGSPRAEVEGRFAILAPEYSESVRREAIRSPHLVFDVNREEYAFGQVMIEIGVWCALAQEHELEGDVTTALGELSFAEMREFSDSLTALGASDEQIKQILVAAAAARLLVRANPGLSITKDAYEYQRRVIVDRLGLAGRRGGLVWPPTSQTVRSRLGEGYWSDALTAIGIEASSRGRPRGLLLFEDADYRDALVHFFAHCDATGASRSYGSYESWVLNQERAGDQWPSGPAVRLYYGSWTIAKRRALSEDGVEPRRATGATAVASPALIALHDASVARRELLDRLPGVPGRERAAEVTQFVKDFMGTFETRQRQWFRAIVANDSEAIPRRLASTPALKPAHRELLESTTPDLDAVLTDMYLDNLLAGKDGNRTASQWLAEDVRLEMDVIGEKDAAAAKALREMRNYFTHDSEESKRRVASALTELGQWDATFLMAGSLTRRTLAGWLSSGDCERLVVLAESILASWRAMLAAEAVAAG